MYESGRAALRFSNALFQNHNVEYGGGGKLWKQQGLGGSDRKTIFAKKNSIRLFRSLMHRHALCTCMEGVKGKGKDGGVWVFVEAGVEGWLGV